MKNVDSKKLAGTIIGGIAFIFCLIFFTYAWYVWRSGNITLGGDITDITQIDITLDNDGDVSSSNIGPVLNPEDGIVAGFSADNKDLISGHLYIDLKINTIDPELLNENFKYLIVKSTVSPRTDEEIDKSTLTYDYDNPVASGNFSNFTLLTNLLGEDNVLENTITFYKIFIYLDGSTETDINQQGKSIDAKLIITDTEIKYLNEVPVGSYVAYTGNNGCVGDACSGVSVSGSGYISNGWRIAYIDEEGSVHLVSAGAPEKLCTNSDGTTSNSSCSNYETTYGAPLHIANLNNAALKYCNTKYAKDGVCNNETAWAMKENDFTKITRSSSLNSCEGDSSTDCGLDNDLIEIGGFYWFATPYNSASSLSVFHWYPHVRRVDGNASNGVYGVRPVLRLESSIVVTGGEGTETNPYRIEKLESQGELAATYITSLYDSSRATTVHIADDSSKPTVSLDSTSGIMLDNNDEYRYYGATPNNYVSFNNELWRIINVANVKSNSTDTTGETRVRIIRADSIGNHPWDMDDYTNNWETATLNTTLNGIYYNGTSGDCYLNGSSTNCDYASGDVKGLNSEARGLISDAVWYLGGGNTSDLYADDYYTMERGTTVSTEGYPYRWTGKLGLMYPSDYAYAADLSQCTKTGLYYDTDTTNCTGTDWLFNSEYQWLMSPHSGYSNYAWIVDGTGFVNSDDVYYVGDEFGVRPLAVLKSDVVITGGDGSSDNPYTLAIN